MVSTTGEHHAYFELDEALRPVEKELPAALRESVARIKENCEPALCTVLFMGGAGGSLRAGVTENPVRLTHSVRDALTRVTCGGAPVYVWPGGGITFMVDVSRMPETCFRLRAHSRSGCTHRVHPEHQGLCRTRRLHGPRSPTGLDHGRQRATKDVSQSRITRGRCSGEIRMKPRAQVRLLEDGRRLHLHDGPIDLVIEAFGEPCEINAAYHAARNASPTCSTNFVANSNFCEKARRLGGPLPSGVIARRMVAAVTPYRERMFITPMAAVAGAVAEEMLGVMTAAAKLSRAYVNDGGDIALHLAPGEHFVVGMVERPDRPSLFGTVTLDSMQPVRGIATSGWRGRSFSLGIADAVTVLADDAAMADAAATVIANAVDLPGHPSVVRMPARSLAPDSDLGDRLVTQGVGELSPAEIETRSNAGLLSHVWLLAEGLIRSAALHLRRETRVVGQRSKSARRENLRSGRSSASALHQRVLRMAASAAAVRSSAIPAGLCSPVLRGLKPFIV